MNDKTGKGFSTSIYVSDKQTFEECKRLLKLQGRSLSEEIMDFILRRLEELRGTVNPDTSDQEAKRKYLELKQTHITLVGQVEKLINQLEKQPDVYGEANELLAELKVTPDLGNTSEVVPKFLLAWKGSTEFAHMFVTLIELAKDKKDIERKLSEIRSAKPIIVSELPALAPP
jgi:hypothetical protein